MLDWDDMKVKIWILYKKYNYIEKGLYGSINIFAIIFLEINS